MKELSKPLPSGQVDFDFWRNMFPRLKARELICWMTGALLGYVIADMLSSHIHLYSTRNSVEHYERLTHGNNGESNMEPGLSVTDALDIKNISEIIKLDDSKQHKGEWCNTNDYINDIIYRSYTRQWLRTNIYSRITFITRQSEMANTSPATYQCLATFTPLKSKI